MIPLRGIVTLDDKNVVRGFEEKPRKSDSNLANGAIYLFSKDALLQKTMTNVQNDRYSPKILGR